MECLWNMLDIYIMGYVYMGYIMEYVWKFVGYKYIMGYIDGTFWDELWDSYGPKLVFKRSL